MIKLRLNSLVLLLALLSVGVAQSDAQGPPPSKEHELLKRDLGSWKAELKMWMAPGEEPQGFAAEEINSSIGEYWVVSNFKGDFGGFDFKGHGVFGYDAQKKKFVGSWVDSSNPNAMHMIGTYDKESDTLTYETKGVGPTGEPVVGKATTVYKKDGTRVYTMYQKMGESDEMTKVMEITYSKAK